MVEHRSPKPSVGSSNLSYPATNKVKIMEKLIGYVRHSKLELSKVIFPLKEQIKTAFISVIIVVTVISLFLALIDLIMSTSLSAIMSGQN